MAFEFKLPDLGEGVQEGEIIRWLVAVGDPIRAEQPLVEVMTDKVTAELPSPVTGTVISLAGEAGKIVPVGSVLVTIEPEASGTRVPAGPSAPITSAAPRTEGGAVTAPAATNRVEPPSPGHGERPFPGHGERPAPTHGEQPSLAHGERTSAFAAAPAPAAPAAVPAVRRLARELGVDLATVRATGPESRILESDVRAAAAPSVPASPPGPSTSPEGRFGAIPRSRSAGGEVQRIPLRGKRRVIAEHLLDAHRNTAPYTFVEEADVTELVGLRTRVQPMAQKAGVRMTYLPFFLAAVSMALRDHPHLNATVDGATGDLLVHQPHDLGLAVHTEEGLVVPVIRDVQHRNLLDLAREIERLSEGARRGILAREDVLGGTFSVTSLGRRGGIFGTPMLNTPQVAVLGIHRIAPRPVVREGAVVPRQTVHLSLTLDHRYIDGYVGAGFAETLVRYLEDPAIMLFWLSELRP